MLQLLCAFGFALVLMLPWLLIQIIKERQRQAWDIAHRTGQWMTSSGSLFSGCPDDVNDADKDKWVRVG